MYAAVPRITPAAVARAVRVGERVAEVEKLHAPGRRDLHVRGLQVAVDDAILVRRLQCFGDLLRIRERFLEWKGTGSDLRVEALAFDEFHDEEVPPGNFLEGVNRRDARVVQRGERLRFPFEAKPSLFIFEELFRQDLDRDVSREPRVPRPIDLSHPARAEGGDDLVRAEAGAGDDHFSPSAR
jgi:hypothetical protein